MSEYHFKTVYFPKEKVRKGKAARVNLSLPAEAREGLTPEFITYLKSLNSRDFRLALGNPYLEDLESKAHEDNRSFSNTCLSLLKANYNNGTGNNDNLSAREKFDFDKIDVGLGVTFKDSLRQGVFGWYPYVEGFSATYVRDALLRYGKKPATVYDPFGGSGTTQLAAALLGIQSFYSELNPFMSFVAQTKVRSARWARNNLELTEKIVGEFLPEIVEEKLKIEALKVDLSDYHKAFPKRDFFEEQHIRELLAAMDKAKLLSKGHPELEALLLLACVSNAVAASNMTRRADLRRRRDDEYKNRVVNVSQMITESTLRFIDDIKQLPLNIADMEEVSSDARNIPEQYNNAFDFVLTSPPYLNGTNYFRNTKIELWLLSLIETEKDLRKYRDLTVTGGINDVCKNENYKKFPSVEQIAKKLDLESKDKRIPTMVRHYFSDMSEVLDGVYKSLKPGGRFLLDIGDSKFYGVHVPTDKLLIDVAIESGFILKDHHVLAKRMSRDKTELVQAELVFEKPTKTERQHTGEPFKDIKSAPIKEKISDFQKALPYKNTPYTKKTWGHPLHSLCSYQGKLKPSLAHWLIEYFVPAGGTVLDPIGGVGTIPFEAALSGHCVVSNDKSPFPALIAKAKLSPPKLEDVAQVIESIKKETDSTVLTKTDYEAADFGLNAKIKDYYHPETLDDLLKLRKIFLSKRNENSNAEDFFWASLLHILHGNRPYALSRTSHPITPFSPTGDFVKKDVFQKVYERAQRSLSTPLPDEFKPGIGLHADFRDIPKLIDNKFDAIITSPPFYGMRFDRPNWLRLWFCGWGEDHFHKESLNFLERQQVKDVSVYKSFFATCLELLKESGVLILHLGSGGRKDLVEDLKKLAPEDFILEGEVYENVQAVSKHGIKDKGYTKKHALLFFTLR